VQVMAWRIEMTVEYPACYAAAPLHDMHDHSPSLRDSNQQDDGRSSIFPYRQFLADKMHNKPFHSQYEPRRSEPILPSDRKFGMLFFAVFAIIAGVAFYRTQSLGNITFAFAGAALLMLGLTWLYPKMLRPLNMAWMSLGLWLGKIVSPVVLGLVFLLLFTPLALVLRLCGRDELALKRSPSSKSYWQTRSPDNVDAHGYANQF